MQGRDTVKISHTQLLTLSPFALAYPNCHPDAIDIGYPTMILITFPA